MTSHDINIKAKQLYQIAEALKCTSNDEIFHCAEVIADYAKTLEHIAEDYVPLPSEWN